MYPQLRLDNVLTCIILLSLYAKSTPKYAEVCGYNLTKCGTSVSVHFFSLQLSEEHHEAEMFPICTP